MGGGSKDWGKFLRGESWQSGTFQSPFKGVEVVINILMESEGQKVLHFKQSGNTTQQVLGLSRWLPFAHAFCQDKEWDGKVFTTWILILFHCKWPLHMPSALKPPMEDMDRQVFTNWLFALAFGSCPDREWGYFICLDHMSSLGETGKFLPTDSLS